MVKSCTLLKQTLILALTSNDKRNISMSSIVVYQENQVFLEKYRESVAFASDYLRL